MARMWVARVLAFENKRILRANQTTREMATRGDMILRYELGVSIFAKV